MKHLLRYVLFIVMIALVALTVINFLTERLLKKQKEDVFGKLNEIFSGEEYYDALFLGSSRTLVQINPHIVDSILNSNSYNLGILGISIIECKMLLNSYLKRHKPPQLLILNVDMFSLNIHDTTSLFDFPIYFPYLDNPVVKKTMRNYTASSKIVSVLPFLKLAFYDDFKKEMALKAFLHPKGNPENILYKGYAPKNLKWKADSLISRFTIQYTRYGFNILKEVLNICSENKIKTAVIYAPQSDELNQHLNNFSVYKNLIKEICTESNVEFYDYSSIQLTKNRNYFYNHSHLNSQGADVFTALLANEIKKKYKDL